MPILGADMRRARSSPGARSRAIASSAATIVAEVETDKGLIDVEIFASGVIERLLVEPGPRCRSGRCSPIIREEGGAGLPRADAAPRRRGPCRGPAGAAGRPLAEPLRISPSARQLAHELGIDPAAIAGTGPDGRDQPRGRRAAPPPERPASAVRRPAGRAPRAGRTVRAAPAQPRRRPPSATPRCGARSPPR